MSSDFLPNSIKVNESYKNIKLSTQENPKTKNFKGKNYTFYGTAVKKTELSDKVSKIFTLILATLIIPLTLFTVLAYKPFRDLLKRNFQIINETPIKIYVLEKLKQDSVLSPVQTSTKPQIPLEENKNTSKEEGKNSNNKPNSQKPPAPSLDDKSKPGSVVNKTQTLPNPPTPPKKEELKNIPGPDQKLPNAQSTLNDKAKTGPANNPQQILSNPQSLQVPAPLNNPKENLPGSQAAKVNDAKIKEQNIANPNEALQQQPPLKQENQQPQPQIQIPPRAPTQEEIVQNYIAQGNLDGAADAILNLPLDAQPAHYGNLARAYFQRRDYNNAIKILANKSDDITVPLFKEFAHSCLQEELYEESKKFLKVIPYLAAKDTYIEFAKLCCKTSKYEKADEFIMFLEKWSQKDYKVEIFTSVAQERIAQNNLADALEVINVMGSLESSECEKLRFTIAEKYLEKKDLVDAEDALSDYSFNNYQKKWELFGRITKEFFRTGEYDHALRSIKRMGVSVEVKELYIQIAKKYMSDDMKDMSNDMREEKAFNALKALLAHGRLVQNKDKKAITELIKDGKFVDALKAIEASPLRDN